MPKPEDGKFYEITLGTGTGTIFEVISVLNESVTTGPHVEVRLLGAPPNEVTRLPINSRWETGMQEVNTCPSCGNDLPGEHSKNCRFHFMEALTAVAKKPKTISEIAGGGPPPELPGTLAEKIRALATPKQSYIDANADEQMVMTAMEFESLVVYMGLDDVLNDYAASVERMESLQELPISMHEVVGNVQMEEGYYIIWRCPEDGCGKQVLCVWDEGLQDMKARQTCEHDFGQPEWTSVHPEWIANSQRIIELESRLAEVLEFASKMLNESAKTVPLGQIGSTLEYIATGDPGHNDEDEWLRERAAAHMAYSKRL